MTTNNNGDIIFSTENDLSTALKSASIAKKLLGLVCDESKSTLNFFPQPK